MTTPDPHTPTIAVATWAFCLTGLFVFGLAFEAAIFYIFG